jgi:LytS/YehU family sensor histidine kinase
VICVVFITHVYETVYLIQQREDDLLAVERLERARTEAELAALKAQVAPHFLFNSLNTLSWLIEHYPKKALAFNQDLAEVYRYILVAHRRELAPLEEELAFARRYFNLLKLRFEASLELDFPVPGERAGQWFLPPISLQVLLENAVKHNEHSGRQPLRMRMWFEEDAVAVSNEKRPLIDARPGSGTGLKSLDNRCRLALGRGIAVQDTTERFTVRVPVRSVPA